MRVAVLFERSGIVRDAFSARHHDALSVDLEPSESPAPNHWRGDVFQWIGCEMEGWAPDLVIAHPPCTALTVSGNRWYSGTRDRQESIEFVESLWRVLTGHVKHVCFENPVGVLSTQSELGRPDQSIQPYQFGHPDSKRTCLWLHNLPKLCPTRILHLPACGHWDNQTPSGQNRLGPSEHRAMDRARTYPGIAAAMAEQWGG